MGSSKSKALKHKLYKQKCLGKINYSKQDIIDNKVNIRAVQKILDFDPTVTENFIDLDDRVIEDYT